MKSVFALLAVWCFVTAVMIHRTDPHSPWILVNIAAGIFDIVMVGVND